MGQKSAKVWGLSFLGIRARKVEFREGGTNHETLIWSIEKNRAQEIKEMLVEFNRPTVRTGAAVFFKSFESEFNFMKTHQL